MKMKLSSLLPAALICSLPSLVYAFDYSVDSTTILRIEKRDIPGGDKENLMPATEFIGMDLDKMADGNLSLHLYGWGRADLADNSFSDKKTNGSLTYGYLQYRLKEASTDIRAGRLFVHEGIVNEQIDGLSARSDLAPGFGLSVFGGATVHTKKLFGENSDGKGDSIFGGRANYRYKGSLEIGISGLYESKSPVLINYTNGDHRLIGSDIWFSPNKMIELMGQSSYNTENSHFAEHSYRLNIKPDTALVLTGEYNEQHDKSYQYSSAMFSGARLNPGDKSRSVGGSASYAIDKNVELGADYKHYRREIGNADRFGANLRLSFLNNELRSGIGYHYLSAGSGFAISTSPTASYHELRGYILHNTRSYFASIDAVGFFFKDKVYNENSATEAIASLGYHFTPALALSGDVSYGRNPEFTEEIKGLVRLTYNMTVENKGGAK
jgi:hypothetical protein